MQFEHGFKILVIGPQTRHAGTAAAIEGLEHNVLMLVAEGKDRLLIAGDQGRWLKALKAGDEQLFRGITHLERIIDHQGLGVDALEKVGGGDVGHVEGRILPHQNHIHFGQVAGFHRPHLAVIALHGLNHGATASGKDPLAKLGQVFGLIDPQAVTARLSLHHHHEAGVGGDVDPLDGVHLDGDLQAHGVGSL